MMAATLIGFTGATTRAQSPEDWRWLLPQWDSLFSVRSGAGYKDNVFLSPLRSQASAFLSGGADAMIMRIDPAGSQFTVFASGDARYYPSTNPSHTEYTAFGQAEWKQDFGSAWQRSLAADYFYQDQFLDVTFLDATAAGTNVASRAAAVRGHTITMRPGLRRDWSHHIWLEWELPVTRQYFNEPLDDYWEAGVNLTLGHQYGHSSRLSLAYAPTWRFLDSDSALSSTGSPIPGTHRRRFEQEAVFTWRHYWDEGKHWRTTTRLSGRWTQENGGGFSDYRRWAVSEEIRYHATSWEVSAEGRIRQYFYGTQTVSPTDLSKRNRTEWTAGLRLERQLIEHLRFIALYEHEEVMSNDPLEPYAVNTVSGELQWEF